jgi:hypothetical protein
VADPTLTNAAEGTSTLATTTATFGFTATANRLLLLVVSADNYNSGNPTGYTLSPECEQEFFLGHYVWWKKAAGGETSVQYTILGADPSCWSVFEFDNVDAVPFDASEGTGDSSTSSTFATPTITPTTGRRLLFAAVGGSSSDRNITATGAWSDSFIAAGDIFTTVVSGTQDAHGAAYRVVDGNGVTTFTTTATFTVGGSVQSHGGIILAFKVGGAGGISVPVRAAQFRRRRN